jgi:mannitol 2-dehydrogenase
MTVKLSLATLDRIRATAATPAYDRSKLTAGILHFGIGNFHRAHQAVYLDDLFNRGRDHDWAVVGAGVLPSDATMRSKLAEQNFLTTVVEQRKDSSAARVIGSMIDYLAPGDAPATIARLADPAIRIVSLTITEGGYFLDPASGRFNPNHPAIVADGQTPDNPKTVFGLIVAGLKVRRANGNAPFTVMSCDNIPGNGEVTHAAIHGLARLSDPAFADWIDANVAFPNAMVDRITPATGPREIGVAASEYAIDDNWPVFCEEFKQWVLEDKFPQGRPALEEVGVQFVPDVAPYEHMKIRILNGGHAAIAYPAALLDFHFVHEAMADPDIGAFLAKLTREEIIPVLPPVPGTDLGAYFDTIVSRFSNPKIGDTVPRLAQDGSNRQPKFILPTTADRLDRGEDVTGLALVSALWCQYLRGLSDAGKEMDVKDEQADVLRPSAARALEEPERFLGLKTVFGDLGGEPVFRESFRRALDSLQRNGTRLTLQLYAQGKLH